MNTKTLITLVAVVLCPVATWADYKETRDFTLPAANLGELRIECGAGSLSVVGVEGLANIEVEAEIIVDGGNEKSGREYIQKRVTLDLKKRKGDARLIAETENGVSGWRGLLKNQSARINLKVRIPMIMHLEIEDGSGDIKIENLGAGLFVDDGSGSTRIEDIDGNVIIDDGSGELRIIGIRGDLEVEDGSGSLRIADVTGDVIIDDGSGDLTVHDVDGSIEVNDGSGDIDIDEVGDDVIILDEGSGGHDIDNVKGTVRWQ